MEQCGLCERTECLWAPRGLPTQRAASVYSLMSRLVSEYLATEHQGSDNERGVATNNCSGHLGPPDSSTWSLCVCGEGGTRGGTPGRLYISTRLPSEAGLCSAGGGTQTQESPCPVPAAVSWTVVPGSPRRGPCVCDVTPEVPGPPAPGAASGP